MSTDEELDPRFNGAADQVKLQDFYQHAARAIELTGGSADTLAEALDQWEREREALAELFDENQALSISFRLYDITMTLAEQIINVVEIDAQMFMTQKSRDKIAKFREQLQILQKRRANDREIVIAVTNRRNYNEQTP